MSYIQFLNGFEKRLKLIYQELFNQSVASEEAIISKHLELDHKGNFERKKIGAEVRLKIPHCFSRDALIKYAILSWYMPSYTQFELQETLRQRCKQVRFFEGEALLLHSKELMLFTLYREVVCKHNHLFGNILQPGVHVSIKDTSGKRRKYLSSDYCYLTLFLRKPPKQKVFKRGYNDHHSLAPYDAKARREAETLSYQAHLEHEIEVHREKLLASTKRLELLAELKRGIGT